MRSPDSQRDWPLKTAKYLNPLHHSEPTIILPNTNLHIRQKAKIQQKQTKITNEPKINWGSSQTVNVGMDIHTKLAASSCISYPDLRKKSSSQMSPPRSPFEKQALPQITPTHHKKNGKNNLSRDECITPEELDLEDWMIKKSDAFESLRFKAIACLPQRTLITLQNLNYSFELPDEVCFMSETLRHICDCSRKSFSFDNRICLPTFSDIVFHDITHYLLHLWANKYCKEAAKEIGFNPNPHTILELILAGLYLTLPALVNLCIEIAAQYIEAIDSFGDLPRPIIRNILSRISIKDLANWERTVEAKRHYTLSETSWIKNYGKIIRTSSNSFLDTPTRPSLLSAFCRKRCIQFYVQETLSKMCGLDASFLEFLRREGAQITHLSIVLENSPIDPDWDTWICAFRLLPCLVSCSLDSFVLNEAIVLAVRVMKRQKLKQLSLVFRGSKAGNSCDWLVNAMNIAQKNAIESKSCARKPFSQKMRAHIDERMDVAGINRFISDDPSQHTINELLSDAVPNHEFIMHFTIFGCAEKLATQSVIGNMMDVYAITTLKLSDQILDCASVRCLSLSLGVIQNLTNFELTKVSANSEDLVKIVQVMESLHLKKLELSKIAWSVESGGIDMAKAIAKWLSNEECEIQDLNLSDNDFTILGLMDLFKGLSLNKSIRFLNLSSVGIKTSLAYLSAALAKRLSDLNLLDISNNLIVARSMNDFIQAQIAAEKNFIHELSIGRNHMDSDVFKSLAALISKKRSHIKRLNLGNNLYVFNNGEPDGLTTFIKSLTLNKSLVEIDLSSNSINDMIARLLSLSLPFTRILKVNLSGNQITSNGLAHFQSLSNSTKPMVIDFTCNYIHGQIHAFEFSSKWKHIFYLKGQK